MKRGLHSPWLVALAVLALAVAPVLAALSAHREQARRARELLFASSAEVAAAQLRLALSRQAGWQNTLRFRLSNASEPPESSLNDLLAPGSGTPLPEHCRALAYAARDGGRLVLRWRRELTGKFPAEIGDDLLVSPAAMELLRPAFAQPTHTLSLQHGATLLTAMGVNDPVRRQARGWILASWDLDAMCAAPGLTLVTENHTLTARPLDGPAQPGEVAVEIGEAGAHWRVAIGTGTGFAALFPQVSERAIALTGGGCAMLLALLAGFATRAAGLRAALAAERELTGMKDHLLHSVSHEFRTPLSVILSSTELLENYDARLAPERRTEALAQIRHATARMNDMVGQVLLFSRIEERRLPVEPRTLDVAAFSRELAREIETATQARCPIRVTAPETLEVTLDPALLRAVVGNLLSNAVKFSPASQPVEFAVEFAAGRGCFTIRDRGPGIAAADLPRVREPFFRAASAAEIPGTGLGLTIAGKCAALLGGTLAITSDASGATATFTL